MKMIDANIALRYLLDDHETLSQEASDILENNQVFLTFEVFCEIVYVLEKVYQVPRDEIQFTINNLLDSQQLDTNNPAILKSALELYRNKGC
jgi:predicted nucleic-acid-binding protein